MTQDSVNEDYLITASQSIYVTLPPNEQTKMISDLIMNIIAYVEGSISDMATAGLTYIEDTHQCSSMQENLEQQVLCLEQQITLHSIQMAEQKAKIGKMSQHLRTLTQKGRETKQQLEQLQTDVEDQYYDDIETDLHPQKQKQNKIAP